MGNVTILWPYEGGITSDSFLFGKRLNQKGFGIPLRSVLIIKSFRLFFGEFAWGAAYAIDPFMSRNIAKYIKANFPKDTIIIVSHPWLGMSLKYLKDYKSVYFAHNVESKIIQESDLDTLRKRLLSSYVESLEKKIARMANKVVFVSEDDLSGLDWNFGEKQIQVVGVGSRIPEIPDTAREDFVVFVGGDYLFNIEAVEEIIRIAKKMPEVQFRIIGSVCQKIETTLTNVILMGWVSEAELSRLLSISSIFINPMKHGSGIHLKLVKAMSFGIPIISTPHGWRGFNKINELDVQVVELVDFCQVIRSTFENYQYYKEKAYKNKEIIEKSFSWKVICEKFNYFVSGKPLHTSGNYVDPIFVTHEFLKYENQVVFKWRRILNNLTELYRKMPFMRD